MADDEPKITSEVKVKNPKRVEADKKLAALSKAARERKKLDQSESKTPIVKYTVIGGLGLLVAVGSLYFTYRTYSESKGDDIKPHVTAVKEETATTPCAKSNLESL